MKWNKLEGKCTGEKHLQWANIQTKFQKKNKTRMWEFPWYEIRHLTWTQNQMEQWFILLVLLFITAYTTQLHYCSGISCFTTLCLDHFCIIESTLWLSLSDSVLCFSFPKASLGWFKNQEQLLVIWQSRPPHLFLAPMHNITGPRHTTMLIWISPF